LIPYMHQDLATQHIADIHERACRERAARAAKQARRLRRHSAEPLPASSLLVHPAVLTSRCAAGTGSEPAAERREVA
jgi:hypothetical protein